MRSGKHCRAWARRRRKRIDSVVLSFDPGSVNFAWTLLSARGRLLASGMLPVEFRQITAESLVESVYIVTAILHRWKGIAGRVVWERYQIRGSGSKNNETVNLLLGIASMAAVTYGYTISNPVAPSEWKGYWNRAYKKVFGHNHPKLSPWREYFEHFLPGPKSGKNDMTHRRDSCGIACHCLETGCARPVVQGLVDRMLTAFHKDLEAAKLGPC